MTDTRTSEESPLESRLRAAGAALPQPGVPDGAWQENQRRLLATARAGRGLDRRLLLVAAAVVVALVLGVGAVLLGGGEGRLAGPPGSGDDDPFADSVILGPPVEVETLRVGGQRVVHEAVLSDMTGKGPSLCDRLVSEGSASGGCTSRDPAADDPGVAFDWFTGTSGGGDLRGVLAGVDSRVRVVQVWMSNGDLTSAALLQAGWEGTGILGLTVPADGPRPQRLVAYGDKGRVLQSLDLPSLLDKTWLGGSSDCSTTNPVRLSPDDTLPAITVTPTRLGVFADVTSTSPAQCLRLGASLQAFRVGDRDLVVLVPPEVVSVQLRQSVANAASWTPGSLRGVLWRVALVHGSRLLSDADTVVALDETGREVSRATLSDFR